MSNTPITCNGINERVSHRCSICADDCVTICRIESRTNTLFRFSSVLRSLLQIMREIRIAFPIFASKFQLRLCGCDPQIVPQDPQINLTLFATVGQTEKDEKFSGFGTTMLLPPRPCPTELHRCDWQCTFLSVYKTVQQGRSFFFLGRNLTLLGSRMQPSQFV